MQNKVYGNLYEKLMGEVASFEKNSHYLNSKSVNTSKTPVCNIPINLLLVKKINELYASIKNARKVLSWYKMELSANSDYDNNLTPLTNSNNIPMLFYKREDLTSINAYKIRGAFYQMCKLVQEKPSSNLKFITASTGNHALGVLKAAEIIKVSNVTICISKNVTDFKRQELKKKVFKLKSKGINAELVVEGENFDQTNQFAKNLAEFDESSFYIDPYNTHNAVAGQGTIGLELLFQLDKKFSLIGQNELNKIKELTVVVPIGGGGLISGISCALKTGMKNFKYLKHLKLNVIGVNLDNLNSKYGDAIKVKTVGNHNSELINYFVENKIVIDDNDMEKGMNFVYQDIGAKVEGASAGTLKPILENSVIPSENNVVVCVLSGGNII